VVAVVLSVMAIGAAWAESAVAAGSNTPTSPAASTAPGRPGAIPSWLPADKQGFGTSTSLSSRVWFTLEGGELSEVYFPRIDTPSLRDLQFVITDGRRLTGAERDSTRQRVVLRDGRSLIYEQINTERHGRWRLTKTYVTDPKRATVTINVSLRSLKGGPYRVYVVANPSLANGSPESGTCAGSTMTVSGTATAAAIVTKPAMIDTSCGYKGRSDGLLDLRRHHRLSRHYRSAPKGNVVITAATPLTGARGHDHLTVALSFGTTPAAAVAVARASLRTGWSAIARGYARGWHRYLASLKSPPSSLATAAERRAYAVSAMVLAASEDKTHRGAYVASPTMPWEWGTGLQTPSGPYHLVWSRDLYEIATALIADGDMAGARRALRFLLNRQQRSNGSFPQNSDVTGKAVLTNLQLDEVADPPILAQQLDMHDPATWSHVKRAADFLLGWHDKQGHHAPYSPQERWENQAGYSPATIAAEIAGLVCAADIAQRNGAFASAVRYLATADRWRAHLNAWTLTTTGPFGPSYYLRLSKNGRPNSGVRYKIGDSGPSAVDQRRVVDPSFLELVRLGVVSPADPNIVSTLSVVDRRLGDATPAGLFWHRYSDDGYGEQRNGQPWNVNFPPNSRKTLGRLWPLLTGERGEYALAAGAGASTELAEMAATINPAGFLPEQVWDQNPPSSRNAGRFVAGHPTFSATPLAWTHAQLIRLAWSISAGHPIEQPAVVACRYARACTPP
jgi:glucoamylase